jgi:pyruvate/2-oxoglutarate dehydrogenase complex dihydrolipoamide acyltransferase (E2) component
VPRGAPRQRSGTSSAGRLPHSRIGNVNAPQDGGWITIQEWRHKLGEHVNEGDVLVVVTTETMADLELPAARSGVLSEIFAPEGAQVAAGSPLGDIDPAAYPTVPSADAAAPAYAPPPSYPPLIPTPRWFRETRRDPSRMTR